jgi:hypothetical protein
MKYQEQFPFNSVEDVHRYIAQQRAKRENRRTQHEEEMRKHQKRIAEIDIELTKGVAELEGVATRALP